MKYVTLNNGIKMPMLGFGVFRVEDGKDCIDSVKTALATGYRSIDTAAIYGNEKSVGTAIKKSGIPREELFITTKIWNEVQRTGDVEIAFKESLTNLGTDYLDLYLIHWPVKGRFVETWLTFEKLYKGGLIKAIGISNFNEHHIEDIKKVWSIVPAVNQIELHPRLTQKPLVNYCQELGIVVESWSPLGGSKPGEVRNSIIQEPLLATIGKKYNKTPAQVILRWNIELGFVTIPKSTTPERIRENIDIFNFELTPEDIAAIDNLNKNQRVGPDPDDFNF